MVLAVNSYNSGDPQPAAVGLDSTGAILWGIRVGQNVVYLHGVATNAAGTVFLVGEDMARKVWLASYTPGAVVWNWAVEITPSGANGQPATSCTAYSIRYPASDLIAITGGGAAGNGPTATFVAMVAASTGALVWGETYWDNNGEIGPLNSITGTDAGFVLAVGEHLNPSRGMAAAFSWYGGLLGIKYYSSNALLDGNGVVALADVTPWVSTTGIVVGSEDTLGGLGTTTGVLFGIIDSMTLEFAIAGEFDFPGYGACSGSRITSGSLRNNFALIGNLTGDAYDPPAFILGAGANQGHAFCASTLARGLTTLTPGGGNPERTGGLLASKFAAFGSNVFTAGWDGDPGECASPLQYSSAQRTLTSRALHPLIFPVTEVVAAGAPALFVPPPGVDCAVGEAC